VGPGAPCRCQAKTLASDSRVSQVASSSPLPDHGQSPDTLTAAPLSALHGWPPSLSSVARGVTQLLAASRWTS